MRKPKAGWEALCLHNNEVPRVCACPPTCGCRYYHCKVKVEKQEDVYKAKLLDKFKKFMPPGYMQQSHEDVRQVGIPDWDISAKARTSWWEFKHGTPDFESHGRQELTMLRLAASSFAAHYVIWQENLDGSNKRTLIVHPKHIGDLEPVDWCVGFEMSFILAFMRKVHQL